MRTDHDTFTALDTEVRFPHRNIHRNVAFLPLSRSGWERSIYGERRDREIIAVRSNNLAEHISDKFRSFIRDRLPALKRGSNLLWNFHLVKILKSAIHSFKVFHHDGFTTLAVCFFNGMLDFCDGCFAGKNAADSEESCLHDGVHASAHSGLLSDLITVDHIEFEVFLQDVFLHLDGKLIPYFLGTIQTIEQEYGAALSIFKHVHALEEAILMTGHKVRLVHLNQIRCTNRFRSKPQM